MGSTLAGGVGVAFHREHRQSLDLDLFSRLPDLDLVRFRDETIAELQDANTVGMSDATLRLEVSGAPVDVSTVEPAQSAARIAG